jgi:hypothetical protein
MGRGLLGSWGSETCPVCEGNFIPIKKTEKIMGKHVDKMGIYDHSDIKVGDIVIPANPGSSLRSGGSWYPFAICVAVVPMLTLVSEGGDMKWSTTLPSMALRAIGLATPEQMAIARRRYEADREKEREAEVKTALASINLVYRTEWTEYEFGQRPDGVSYSADLEALKAHIKRIEAMGTREGYSRASDITQALVTPEFYKEILACKSGVYSTIKHDHEGMLGIFKAKK